jgi:hypothetical protein
VHGDVTGQVSSQCGYKTADAARPALEANIETVRLFPFNGSVRAGHNAWPLNDVIRHCGAAPCAALYRAAHPASRERAGRCTFIYKRPEP